MDTVVPTALVGVMVALKDIFYDEYLIDSPHLWVDIATQMSAKLISAGVTMEFLVPSLGEMAQVADPVIQGTLSGIVKRNFVDMDSISDLTIFRDASRGGLPKPHYYTFEYGFIEGLSYGGISTAASIMADRVM